MKRLFFTLTFLLLLSFGLQAQTDTNIRKEHFNLRKNLAIEGFDPVAYHTENKAIKGKKEFQYTYNTVNYRFANQINLDLFKTNPQKYEPAYGGWCAYAMGAKGEKIKMNPETFKITNGVLYLFYNKRTNNTLEEWNKKPAKLQNKADQNWGEIIE